MRAAQRNFYLRTTSPRECPRGRSILASSFCSSPILVSPSWWPLIGWLARAVGTLFIRRGGGESKAKTEEIRGRLDRGHGILVFPEGTTTDGTGVRRFFPQLFAAAGDDAPVQTVAVRYRDEQGRPDTGVAFIDDDEFHHHLWRLLGRRRIVVELTFGAPLPPDEPRALAREARERIVADLGAAVG